MDERTGRRSSPERPTVTVAQDGRALTAVLSELGGRHRGARVVQLGLDVELTGALAEAASIVVVSRHPPASSGAASAARQNVTLSQVALADVTLPPGSADIVVGPCSLHALHHADKRALARRAHRWLGPAGVFVVVDPMPLADSDTGASLGRWWARTRRSLLADLGHHHEQPAGPAFWTRALADAGFCDVAHRAVSPGVGMVSGHKRTGPRSKESAKPA